MFPSFQFLNRYNPFEVFFELAVIWLCVYLIYRFLRGTRGAGVVKGLAVLLVLLTLTIRVLGQGSDALRQLNFIYDRFLGLLAILLIVVFQPELRQAMIRLGHTKIFRGTGEDVGEVVTAISDAVSFLRKKPVRGPDRHRTQCATRWIGGGWSGSRRDGQRPTAGGNLLAEQPPS